MYLAPSAVFHKLVFKAKKIVLMLYHDFNPFNFWRSEIAYTFQNICPLMAEMV